MTQSLQMRLPKEDYITSAFSGPGNSVHSGLKVMGRLFFHFMTTTYLRPVLQNHKYALHTGLVRHVRLLS